MTMAGAYCIPMLVSLLGAIWLVFLELYPELIAYPCLLAPVMVQSTQLLEVESQVKETIYSS